MDMDHVATICLAHWPGQVSPWYEDLRRIAKYGSVLGKFVTLETYFAETDVAGLNDRFEMDQYQAPYLKQGVIRNQPDVVSSWVKYWRGLAAVDAYENLAFLGQLVSGQVPTDQSSLFAQWEMEMSYQEMASLETPAGGTEAAQAPTLGEQELLTRVARATEELAAAVVQPDGPGEPRYHVFNSCSFARRIPVDVSQLASLPDVHGPVYAACEIPAEEPGKSSKWALVDVPSMGFVDLTAGTQRKRDPQKELTLVHEGTLRNEFFQVVVHPETGGIQALRGYASRDNRVSQQLAYRSGKRRGHAGMAWDEREEERYYSRMVADEIVTTCESTILGEITSRGRLLDDQDQLLARFEQRMRLWRGSRVLRVGIQLWPEKEPAASPWNAYYCSRFAWKNEGADLYRAVNQLRHKATATQLEAPQYLEIDDGQARTALLTGGLPFHRRIGFRMLDSLLAVRGETAQHFELGIGVDLAHPGHEAVSWMTPETAIFNPAGHGPAEPSAWLFHLNARNVMATRWEPWVEAGQLVGFQVRLLEVAGHRARLELDSFRPIASAQQLDFEGESLGDCRVEDGRVRLDLAPHEWTQLRARW